MSDFLTKFQSDGYLVIENFNTSSACDLLMQRAKELAEAYQPTQDKSIFQTDQQTKTSDDYFLNSGDKIAFFFEKDAVDSIGDLKQDKDVYTSLNKIGHALHDLDPVFHDFSRSSQMRQLTKELALDQQLLIQSMMIFKHARIGGVVDVHQDSTFLYTEPDTCIGFWFALEDATTQNGCLWAKPGGHLTSLRSHFKRKSGGGTEMHVFDETPLDTEGMQPLEVKKGSLVVLHGLLPHYSLPNTSGKSRQAYAIHTINRGAHYPPTNWLQRDMTTLKDFNS